MPESCGEVRQKMSWNKTLVFIWVLKCGCHMLRVTLGLGSHAVGVTMSHCGWCHYAVSDTLQFS